MRAIFTYFAVLLYGWIAIEAQPLWAASLEHSIVTVSIYQQTPDYDAPWRDRPVRRESHFGVLVAGGYILVTADAVRYSKMVEFSRFGDSDRFPLDVVFADEATDLAVLKPQKAEVLAGMVALPLGGPLREGESIDLVTDQAAMKILRTQAMVKEVDIAPVGNLNYGQTHYILELRQPRGIGRSEPLIKEGQLMGMVVTQRGGTVYALPTKVIRHFLQDVGRGVKNYRGFVRLGISVQNLDSADQREYLGAKGSKDGVLVADVAAISPFYGKILPLDILIKVADTRINDHGQYNNSDWGPLHFIDKLVDYYGGDSIKLTILRQGKTINLTAPLTRYRPEDDLIPGHREFGEEHLVIGGLLFQELSLGYLETWGPNWLKDAPVDMLRYWNFENTPKVKGDRLVVLNQVLADPFNKGYESYGNLLLVSVNNTEIRSVAGLKLWLQQHMKEPWIFRFAGEGRTIVMSSEGLEVAHKRIAQQYGVAGESFLGAKKQSN